MSMTASPEERGIAFSDWTWDRAMPRILTSSTRIFRPGITNPNSFLYLHRHPAMAYLLTKHKMWFTQVAEIQTLAISSHNRLKIGHTSLTLKDEDPQYVYLVILYRH